MSGATVLDRPCLIGAPLAERAVVDTVGVDADPLQRQQRDGRRDAAAAGSDQLCRGPVGVDPGVADQTRDRVGGGPEAGRAVDQLLVGQASRAGDVTRVRDARVAEEQVPRAGVDERLAVELCGREFTPKLPGGQARVLFTYLTVARALSSGREELIEALWPYRAPAGADTALSALLSRLRSVLGSDVLCGRGEIHLHRRRLEEIRLAALECYAAVALGVGGSELAPGERVARELAALAPYRERAHALLMEILTARGNSAEALGIYEQLRQRLRDELGATPAPELRELQERLLRR